jgi:cation diffusion facilitator CzcD-associated flavoprotein CzcO
VLIDCVLVGAGPAGLATSVALSARGVEHVVLERGRVGESWRTQRWESFRLNMPGVPLVRGSHKSVGPFPSVPRSGTVSHAVARTWPILQVVADYKRLNAVQTARGAGRA